MSNRVKRRQLAKDLGIHRGLIKGPPARDQVEKPEIAVPEPEGSPHGQFMMAGGALINFVEYPWRGTDSIRDMAVRLHEFLKGGEEPYFEFTAPHDGEQHVFTRLGAAGIVGLQQSRAKGPVDPRGLAKESKIVRVGSIPSELLKP